MEQAKNLRSMGQKIELVVREEDFETYKEDKGTLVKKLMLIVE